MKPSTLLSPSSLPILQQPTLDNSAANNFNRCARLHYLENRLKLLTARENFETYTLEPIRSPAIAFGDLLHIGLAEWYKTKEISKAQLALLNHPFTDPVDDYRTKEKALRLLTEYIAHYESDDQWEIIFTETAFEVADPSIDFKWGGRIDLVVRWNNKLWIVDHKTTSVFDKNWWDQFFPDTQTAGYTWAASHLHGEPIYGAIVNMIQVNNNVKPKPSRELFQRRSFFYQPYHIEEFLHQSRSVYHEIQQAAERGNDFRPKWSACVQKYGRCNWYDFCRLEPGNRERFLANETVPNTWNFRDL